MNQLRSVSSGPTGPHVAAAQRMIARAIRAAVPSLGDFCFVHVATARNVTCIAAAHARRDGARTLRALVRVYHVRRSDPASAVAQVLRTGQPLLRAEIARETDPPRHGRAAIIAGLHERLGARSALVVPIEVRHKVIGTLSLGRCRADRPFTTSDIPPVSRLALQIGYILLMATVPAAAVPLNSLPKSR